MAEVDTRALLAALEKVAKEQTLNTFVRSFPGLAGQLGSAVRDGAAAGSAGSAADTNGFLEGVTNAVSGTTGAVSTAIFGSAKLFTQGNARLSDAIGVATESLGQLPLVGNIATMLGNAGTTLAQYTEQSVDTFQDLSRTGAGLNGQLAEFRSLAAGTRMPLDEFASLVRSNSEALSAFNGGVEGGIRNFSKLSRDMFELNKGEYVEQLYNMGYSVEEMNELLADNISLTRNRELQTEAQRQASIKSALELAKQMDIVAKLTGRDAKAARDEIRDRARQGATQARLRLLEQQGVTGAAETYTAMQAELAAGPKVLRDLFDDTVQLGVPLTEATRNFAATNREAYELAQQAKRALEAGDQEAAAELARRAVAATAEQANSTQGLTIATLQQVSSVGATQAQVLEETGNLIDAVNQNARRLAESTGNMVTFADAFNDMVGRMEITQANQITGAPGMADPMLGLARETELFFRNSSAAVNQEIARTFQETGPVGSALTGLTSRISEMNDPEAIRQTVEGLGRIVNSNEGIITRIDDILNNPDMYNLTEQEIERLQELRDRVQANNDVISNELTPSLERAAAAAENRAIDAYITGLSSEAAEALGGAYRLEQEELDRAAAGGDERAQDIQEERSRGALDYLNPFNWFEDGTYGATGDLVRDFGREGQLAVLHGREAVIPEAQLREIISTAIRIGSESLPQMNESVANLFGNLMNNVQPNDIAQQMTTALPQMMEQMMTGMNVSDEGRAAAAGGQEGFTEMFETLNTTLRDLTTLSSRQVNVSERQYKATRGLGTNVFKGL